MGKAQVIRASINKHNYLGKPENEKKRVAAYCRVSTDSEEQATSYTAQVSHYTSFINENPNWEMVDVYADEVRPD